MQSAVKKACVFLKVCSPLSFKIRAVSRTAEDGNPKSATNSEFNLMMS